MSSRSVQPVPSILKSGMMTTYEAILQGDRLEWRQEAPPQTLSGKALQVHVTVLTEVPVNLGNGPLMAAALEKLAQSGCFDNLDVQAWQREVRTDNPLPGREE